MILAYLSSNTHYAPTVKRTNPNSTRKKLRVRLDGGVEKWKDEKLWEDGKYLVFPLMCLVEGVEKWEGEKVFCLIGEKREEWKM